MQAPSRSYLLGILLCVGIASISWDFAQNKWLQVHAIGVLTISILLGILIGNTLFPRIAGRCINGVLFSKQRLLQFGIVLYGFRLTFSDIAHVGARGIIIDAMVLTSTFALAWFSGHKLFKLDTNTIILIGAGSSICGAAAVLATEPVIQGRADQVSVAVSTVIVFGTLSMVLYPVLFQWNQLWLFLPNSSVAFGIFTGSTVHEVAQVVAAAKSMGDGAANTAVITKMVRVMMLVPFLVFLSLHVARNRTGKFSTAKSKTTFSIPWFALMFIAVTGFNSLIELPQQLVDRVISFDTFLLSMAMAGLGLCTHYSSIRKAGYKPLLLGGTLFLWLLLGGGLINRFVMIEI